MKELYQDNKQEIELHQWTIDRRKWLKLALAGIALTQIPWLLSCESKEDENSQKEITLDGKGILTPDEIKHLHCIQNLLVPSDGNGPSAEDVFAHSYFIWMLNDEHLSSTDKTYYIDSLQKLISLCKEKFGKSLLNLSKEEQNLFIANSIESGWTQGYLSKMITIIFEAVLLDPIYGVNPNEIGWDWLEHIGGSPRTNASTKYPEIYKTIPVYG